MTTIAVSFNLSSQLVDDINTFAHEKSLSLHDLIHEMLSSLLDQDCPDEPTKEEVLDNIRRGLEDVFAGRTIDARKGLAQLKRKLELEDRLKQEILQNFSVVESDNES